MPDNQVPNPTPTPAPTPVPSPTPEPSPAPEERFVPAARFDAVVGQKYEAIRKAEGLEARTRELEGRIAQYEQARTQVTPQPQPGNPKPRLFRLPQAQGIINRMGFNNDGVDKLVENVKRAKFKGILGINIGKNADTPIEKAADDYLISLRKVYAHASYVAINISSPNTKNLRQLQGGDELDALLAQLKAEQEKLAQQHGKYVPLAVKIAPDLDADQIKNIAALLIKHRIDGVIATNTTLSREGVENLPHGKETGGLSGAPVREKSTAVIRQLAAELHGVLPIIGVGGILKGADAVEKMHAGAALVQMYSGMIYRGWDLVNECATAIKRAK